MIAFLKTKTAQCLISVGFALLGPFLLPPHVVGVYIPLGSLVFEGDVWKGEPGMFFYEAFFIELAIYSCAVYGVICFYTWLCSEPRSTAGNTSHARQTPPAPADSISAMIATEGKTDAERANEKLAVLAKTPKDGQNR
jgi:hypothetical protein